MSHTEKLFEYRAWVREDLKRCVDFWLKNSIDKVHGGIFTCLDTEGNIYNTDKSVWMQGRCAWTFSYLCHVYGIKQEWLETARSCLDFLEKYCIDRQAQNRMYYLVSEDGKPLVQRNLRFSEGFYAIANAEYYGVTGDRECLARARQAYELVWKLNNHLIADPAGCHNEGASSARPMRALADPMIYLNISSILRRVDPENESLYNARMDICTREILKYHRKKDLHCTLENVGWDGAYLKNVSQGRVVNPGHDCECSWFMMQWANTKGDKQLHEEAEGIFMDAVYHGWDSEFGGIIFLLDSENKPRETTDFDVKRWWPQTEMLIAALMAYRDTKKVEYFHWFEKCLHYVRQYFSRPDGEWYAILRRDNKFTEPMYKGSAIKGPFHVLRMLTMVDEILTDMIGDKIKWN